MTLISRNTWGHRISAPLLFLFFAGISIAQTQEISPPEEILPGLEKNAVILFFTAKVVESNQHVIWNTSDKKVTISGKPVSLKLTGKNIVVVARFTPYISDNGMKFLAAQTQVWTDMGDDGIRYYTSIETLSLEFDEQLFFFPLGPQNAENDTSIEIQLTLKPYGEEDIPQNNLSSENMDPE